MKNCFDNLITLGNISPEITPRSGLFVTDLPGISLNQFEALVKDGQTGVDEFWDKLYKRAKTTFLSQITARLNDSFHVEKVISSELSGVFVPERTINDSESKAGVSIEFLKSKYSVIEIQTIQIWSVGAVEGAIIEIIDNDTEVTIKTIEADLNDGFNIIDVFEQFENENIRVVYDPTQVQSIETTNFKHIKKGCCTLCTRGVEQINGGGLQVEFSTLCSLELFVCSRIGQFKTAFWYWIGVELMKERLTSELTNCFTIDLEEAKRLLDIYDGEFQSALDPILKNMKIKDDHVCFDCKGSVTKKVLLP